jgi:hypothetical protein
MWKTGRWIKPLPLTTKNQIHNLTTSFIDLTTSEILYQTNFATSF